MDRKGPEYVNGEVKVHPKVRDIMRNADRADGLQRPSPMKMADSNCRLPSA